MMTQPPIRLSSSNPELHIDIKSIIENLNFYNSLNNSLNVLPVIKADAYGLGVEKIATSLFENGAKGFFVARMEEAIYLRKLNISCELYVFEGYFSRYSHDYKKYNIVPILNSIDQYYDYLNSDINLPLCIHIDTGMNRLGFKYSDVLNQTLRFNNVDIIISHLVSADETNNPLNKIQLNRFNQVIDIIKPKSSSLSASYGALLGEDYLFDFIRPGIGLWGLAKNSQTPSPFKNCVSLYADIIQISKLSPFESVGYNAKFNTNKTIKTATVSIGYADGLPRCNNLYFYHLNSKKFCKVVGTVSMDLAVIDVSDIDVKISDVVEIFGKNNPIDHLINASNKISYDILTSINKRTTRVYL